METTLTSSQDLGHARLRELGVPANPLHSAIRVLRQDAGLDLEAVLAAIQIHALTRGDAALAEFTEDAFRVLDTHE